MKSGGGGGRGGGGRGRGEYYKNKYGNKRREREEMESDGSNRSVAQSGREVRQRGSLRELVSLVNRLHDQNYPRYHELQGSWSLDEGVMLVFDHIQGDPFASPSCLRLLIPHTVARFPEELLQSRIRRIALCDYVNRWLYRAIHTEDDQGNDEDQGVEGGGGYHSLKGGQLRILQPSQQVMECSSVVLTREGLQIRFQMTLPARGRRIAADACVPRLENTLPSLAGMCRFARLDPAALRRHVLSVEDQDALRAHLASKNLVAFIANGSILPRAAGDSDLPLRDAVPFMSDPSLLVTLDTPNAGPIQGMGIAAGVTVIVGGGFHGKSTLLRALEMGVFNHIPGDGREKVVCIPEAVKIRAEDGRSVTGVNISPFIDNLPFRKNTKAFDTTCASGSTSQAASLMEALECGATAILIDEDTSATNFMIRDAQMAQLIADQDEPITPFVHHVRRLQHVSCILVMGGSSQYLSQADLVVQMKAYQPINVTDRARSVMSQSTPHTSTVPLRPVEPIPRCLLTGLIQLRSKIKCHNRNVFQIGDDMVDVSAVEQIGERAVTYTIAHCVMFLMDQCAGSSCVEMMQQLDRHLDEQTLDILSTHRGEPDGSFKRPRALDVMAAMNRIRKLKVNQRNV